MLLEKSITLEKETLGLLTISMLYHDVTVVAVAVVAVARRIESSKDYDKSDFILS